MSSTTAPVMSEEVEMLEKQILELREKLAAARRRVPKQPVNDYEFETTDGPIRLSELFGSHRDLLVVHNMGRSCAYCTLWADGFNGVIAHLGDRTAFALASPDDAEVQEAFAAERGWAFRTISGAKNTFAHDLGFEPEPGTHWPGVSAFHRQEDGTIVRTGCTTFGPGDSFCSVWHFFEMLNGGTEKKWAPKFSY